MRNSLSELRSERGLSQQALADLLGVSRQTIISIEKGRFDPSLPLAFRIAATFELFVTILAIFELLVFMGVVAPGFSLANFTAGGWNGADGGDGREQGRDLDRTRAEPPEGDPRRAGCAARRGARGVHPHHR